MLQVPVGTKLYGLMPASRQSFTPSLSYKKHILIADHNESALERYQVQTVGRDPDAIRMGTADVELQTLRQFSICRKWAEGGTIPGKKGEPSYVWSQSCFSI